MKHSCVILFCPVQTSTVLLTCITGGAENAGVENSRGVENMEAKETKQKTLKHYRRKRFQWSER